MCSKLQKNVKHLYLSHLEISRFEVLVDPLNLSLRLKTLLPLVIEGNLGLVQISSVCLRSRT